MNDVVVIGAGHAGVSVVDALRSTGYAGRLACIDSQPHRPYERPPLSKEMLLGELDEPVWLREEGFFADHEVELHRGVEVAAIDPGRHRTVLADGSELAYAKLVLATGARNRRLGVPGEDLARVVALRTLDDARALRAQLDVLDRLVVVGAGFIGLEVAAAARAAGTAVTVLEAAPRVLSRAVSEETSRRLAELHRGSGVDLRLGVGVAGFSDLGPDSVEVESATGERHRASLAVVGVGVVPETRLAERAGLRVADGTVVDQRLCTSDPDIFAVGDCVRFPDARGGGLIRLESVQNATDQGVHVASVLTGSEAAYTDLPWFWSHQGSIRLQIAGLRAPGDTATVRGDPGSDRFSVFLHRREHLVAVESVNDPAVHLASRKILERGLEVTQAQAADAGFDLRTHARPRR